MNRNLIISLLALVIVAGCSKEENSDYVINQFWGTATVSPENTAYTTNDTLWISGTLPVKLSANTGESFDITQSKVQYQFVLRKWAEKDEFIYSHFNLSCVDNCTAFTHFNNASIIGITYSKGSKGQQFSFGIAFNEPGIYSIDTDYLTYTDAGSETTDYYGKGEIVFSDNKSPQSPSLLDLTFSNSNRNFNVYQELNAKIKAKFEPVDNVNSDHYFFIEVLP